MPWSICSAQPCVINGNEGEWVATCVDAATAVRIVSNCNAVTMEPGADLNAALSTLSTSFSTDAFHYIVPRQHQQFEKDVDAVIAVTDRGLKVNHCSLNSDGTITASITVTDAETKKMIEDSQNPVSLGWTNKL